MPLDGGESRLNRDNHNRFGDEVYAAEELVAEIGAAFACAQLGITPELRADHVQYVASWLKILKEDKRAIFTASAAATRAVEYLGRCNRTRSYHYINSGAGLAGWSW